METNIAKLKYDVKIAELQRRLRDANRDIETIPTPAYTPWVPYTPPQNPYDKYEDHIYPFNF